MASGVTMSSWARVQLFNRGPPYLPPFSNMITFSTCKLRISVSANARNMRIRNSERADQHTSRKIIRAWALGLHGNMAMTMEYLKPYPTTASGYRIELAKQSRLPDILKLMRENYRGEEKIGRMLKASFETGAEEEEAKCVQEDDDNIIAAIYERSPCLIVVQNGTEEVVGVILTILSRREGEEEERNGAGIAEVFKSLTFKSKFVKDYYRYLAKMDEEAGIYQKYPEAEAVMEFFAIAVHKDHRQKGLAKDLMQTALQIAKCIPGLRVVFSCCSSIYTRRITEEIGMVNLVDIDLLETFKNDDAEPVFRDVDRDSVVSYMVLEI